MRQMDGAAESRFAPSNQVPRPLPHNTGTAKVDDNFSPGGLHQSSSWANRRSCVLTLHQTMLTF